MLTSTRYQISYPNPATRADTPDVPRDIAAVVAAVERSTMYSLGLFANRPVSTPGVPGIEGRFYYATDTSAVYFDYGTGWIDLTTVPQGVPAGVTLDFAGSVLPSGYLWCDGVSYLRVDYAVLFAAIGTQYGAADGTHFNVPPASGRVVVTRGSNAAVDTLGENEGVAEANRRGLLHIHGSHTHPPGTLIVNIPRGAGSAGNISLVGTDTAQIDTVNKAVTGNTGATDVGSGVGTDPLHGGAFIVLNKIIKT